jgi:predicted small metal-binding protein
MPARHPQIWFRGRLEAKLRDPIPPEEATMKELTCRDIGFDCDAVVRGESVDEVMAQAGPHAKEVHGVDVTPEMAGKIRTLVRDA